MTTALSNKSSTSVLVALPWSGQLRELIGDIASAASRALKADPGDRIDVARYERLCTQLETQAWSLASDMEVIDAAPGPGLMLAAQDIADPIGAPLQDRLPEPTSSTIRAWLAAGSIVVSLTVPSHAAAERQKLPDIPPLEVADTWETPNGEEGTRAVEARFRAQVKAAIDPATCTSRTAINPSGISNRVLTQVLREYVAGSAHTRTDASVAYRDGSAATHSFPLRCLKLTTQVPTDVDIELHVALLSIRHTDMDPVVDGAWLRNAEVSRPRPAALTDDFVYETSLKQFTALTCNGTRTALLHLYQTGLDTAIVGFYRAVTVHLLTHPGTLTIVPRFATKARPGEDVDTEFGFGRPWSTGVR